MSAPSRRRNGSQASCEPCRKGKIRCDHQKPICGSCRRRRLESQCWYHPAPLTKRRASQQLTPTSPLTQRADESRAVQDPDEPVDSTFQRPAGREPSFKTWPFMSSFSTETPPLPVLYEIYDERTQAEQLAQTEEIVTQLKDLSVIERIIHEYYSFAQVALVRKPILMKLLELLCKSPITAPFVTGQRSSEDLRRLAQNVLRTTASPVTVVESLDVEGFCSLFCGKSLRIEVLGCLYALAARISLYRLSEDPDRTDDFIRRMTRCAQLSNRLFREVSSQPNDVSIWMAHEVMGLTDLMEGDASLRAWRQIGDIATDLYAFGLNREASYTTDSAPFFLRETRREVFVRIYHIDKLYATVFNRPPQLSSRFKDCRAPFDLPDDVLFSSDYAALIRERDELTDDGWNKDQGYRNTTWARMRYIMADFMEETCECQFRTIQPSDHPKLRDISRRCHEAWNALPSHLRYTPDCWHSKLARNACLILAKAYLQFLHIQFQLYRLIDEGSPPSPELLRTSSAMLKTVVQIEKVLPRAFSSPRELPGMILCYGMPTAVILVTALQDALQDPSKTLPPGLSKSSIIRNLSVLICQLETATHQEEANHTVCIQAAKALSRKLDQILDESAVPEPVTPTSADASAGHTVPALSTPAHAVPIGIGQATDLDAVLLNPTFDDFDLENWAVDLDLGAANSGWEMF